MSNAFEDSLEIPQLCDQLQTLDDLEMAQPDTDTREMKVQLCIQISEHALDLFDPTDIDFAEEYVSLMNEFSDARALYRQAACKVARVHRQVLLQEQNNNSPGDPSKEDPRVKSN